MDEISFWVYTKRAPCLFNYDNVVKKQIEQAHCSKAKPASVQSACEEVPSPKKKKRKLKLLDDDSVSSEKQQNVYFETSKCEKQKTAPGSCKSEAIASAIDFNIKNSPQPNTTKRMKLQRNSQTTPQKKNKLVTSTPKVTTNLRRSLRKAQQNHSNSQLNNSFEINNSTLINGSPEEKQEHIEEGNLQKVQSADQTGGQNKSKTTVKEKDTVVPNGQFDDLSDVSGFTANYIRSTKMHSSKRPRKLRSRNSRNLIKDTKQNVTLESEKMLVCVNKSVNTQLPDTAVLNCSTDSSHNVINLVSVKSNEKSNKLNKSTSLLKFIDAKVQKGNTSNKIDKQGSKSNVNISFQSATKTSGTSRYPRRQRNNTFGDSDQNDSKINNTTVNSLTTRHSDRKTSKLNNSDRKENTQNIVTTRTRSGRRLGPQIEPVESGCSGLQLNDSSEQVSSNVALNVASPTKRGKKTNNSSVRCLRSRRCRNKNGQELHKDSISDESVKKDENITQSSAIHPSTPRCISRVKKSMDKTGQSLRRDSLRDKSGFAACFSDSDSDSEPLEQRKFFC
ncbi:unnamed protein product [Euphydryas editha]|uniref:Uncharacterized protein n=1 Tax=Euphydryas editha TaxID=104508 RepID=A0AAU9VED4_EUPED|nr:unnamed protein product [Euphydryas editha]